LLRLSRFLWVLLVVVAFLALDSGRAEADTGLASWYGPGFEGSLTASGEVFDPYGFTAAHRTLPFGTQLSVRYGGRSVLVTVNDRGPYTGGRDLDLSQGAAEYLGLTAAGVDWVHYNVVGKVGYRAGHSASYGANNTSGYAQACFRLARQGRRILLRGATGRYAIGDSGPVRNLSALSCLGQRHRGSRLYHGRTEDLLLILALRYASLVD
jgi:rare lipoprotein A